MLVKPDDLRKGDVCLVVNIREEQILILKILVDKPEVGIPQNNIKILKVIKNDGIYQSFGKGSFGYLNDADILFKLDKNEAMLEIL